MNKHISEKELEMLKDRIKNCDCCLVLTGRIDQKTKMTYFDVFVDGEVNDLINVANSAFNSGGETGKTLEAIMATAITANHPEK